MPQPRDNLVHLRAYVDPSALPTLVLVDLQQEYIATPRKLAVPNAKAALSHCRLALDHARKMGFPVAFTKWICRTPFFNAATPFCQWIEGFVPLPSEMVFERDRPSCYTSAEFSRVMDMDRGANIVLAGFAGETACLSTIIDAHHRAHRVTLLSDASASHPLTNFGADEVHLFISKLSSLYGTVSNARA